MECKHCAESKHVFNFNNRCCMVRWLRGAYKPHAKSYLDQYRIRHGQAAMLKLIEEAKNDPGSQ